MKVISLIILSVTIFITSCVSDKKKPEETKAAVEQEKKLTDDELRIKSDSLAKVFLIIDTHIDVPYRLGVRREDISEKTKTGDFDYPRAVHGGLNVVFMSIYIPPRYEGTGKSKKVADDLIAMVENIADKHPDKFAVAHSIADVTDQFKRGIISFALGMENGSPIEGKLENLKHFYNRGIRYITLAHSKNNHIGDSSYEKKKKWNGLSPFGEEVVKEMNRLGIMVDVSHISDSTFYDVIRLSEVPVIASHSSCRHFTPGWERNMSDEMIRILAKNGGVIQISFGSVFLNDTIRQKDEKNESYLSNYIRNNNLTPEEGREFKRNYIKENHPGYADVKDVVTHINHVVNLVGIDHVGFGSDFDGVGDSLPEGIKDVSGYPNLIYELLKVGYSDEDIEKICSKNLLRVWSEVELYASRMQKNR